MGMRDRQGMQRLHRRVPSVEMSSEVSAEVSAKRNLAKGQASSRTGEPACLGRKVVLMVFLQGSSL